MIHHGKRIPTKFSRPVTIFIFGDLQYKDDSDSFDSEAWEEFKGEFKSTPGALALGLGDYEDFLRPSMRAKLQSSLIGDDDARKQMDDRVRLAQDDIIRRMDFLEGKLIGLHSGHHEWEFATGDNSTQRLCTALRTSYLGWMASSRLIIEERHGVKDSDGPNFTYTIVSMHGSGSAQFASTDARFLETRIVPAWIANHYLRGHSCKSIAWSPFSRHIIRRLGPYGEQEQTVLCMNVGGFSRGYTDGWKSSYIERAGLLSQPVSWGVIRLKISEGICYSKKAGTSSKKSRHLNVEQAVHFPHRPVGE